MVDVTSNGNTKQRKKTMSAIGTINRMELERQAIENEKPQTTEEKAQWWDRLGEWWNKRDLGWGDGSGMKSHCFGMARKLRGQQ